MLGDKPLVAETPEQLLDDDTTPTSQVLHPQQRPAARAGREPDAWKLTIDGEVNKPLEIALGDLKKRFQPKTYRMVLECGGNGRSYFAPQARGNQWTNGGVGCAEWTGVPLADVLRTAGVKASAVYTANYGADVHLSGDPKHATLSRGVPLRKAMDQYNLLVWAMNGKPLESIHGAPLRLVIPGWPGSVSHKWLTKITLRDKVHDGPGMTGTSYRVAIKPMLPGGKADEANFKILESMPVRSIITSPANGTRLGGRHQGDQAEGRGLGRRPRGQARRRVDRLRRHLAAGLPRAAQEPLRLAALDGDGRLAERRLLRDLGAGHRHRQQGRSRISPATGTRRATAPTRCTASPCWWADGAPARLERRKGCALRPVATSHGRVRSARSCHRVAASARRMTLRRRKRVRPPEEQPEQYPDGPNRETPSTSAPPATASRSWRRRACRASAGTRASPGWSSATRCRT